MSNLGAVWKDLTRGDRTYVLYWLNVYRSNRCEPEITMAELPFVSISETYRAGFSFIPGDSGRRAVIAGKLRLHSGVPYNSEVGRGT